MRRLAVLAALPLLLAACGGTRTVTRTVARPADLGPARQEARTDPLATRAGYRPRHGNAEQATFFSGGGCGKERWAVKTLTDPLAARVSLAPQDSTVADLVAIAPPVDPTDRVAPTEETTFRVSGTLVFAKLEADGDYHLVLEDGQGNSMIVESASPSCDQGSLVAGQVQAVRQALDAQLPQVAAGQVQSGLKLAVTVTGVGFFDRLHGQTGVAPNGIELHPLLSVAFGASAPAVPQLRLGATTKSD